MSILGKIWRQIYVQATAVQKPKKRLRREDKLSAKRDLTMYRRWKAEKAKAKRAKKELRKLKAKVAGKSSKYIASKTKIIILNSFVAERSAEINEGISNGS